MSDKKSELHRLLAIEPSTKGFGYCVMETPGILVDWGLKTAKGDKNEYCLREIAQLITWFQPDSMVIEKIGRNSRRGSRIRGLIPAICELAAKRKIKISNAPKEQLRQSLAEGSRPATKYKVAKLLADHFPELAVRLPNPRKSWEAESPNMAIFGAVEIALRRLL